MYSLIFGLLLSQTVLVNAYKDPLPEYIPPDVQHGSLYRHTVELRPDGSVWVQGRNDFGQLGDGTKVHRDEPQKVKSAIKFVPGVPVKIVGLGPRNDPRLDTLDGPSGNLEEYSYLEKMWIARADDGSGNLKVVAARPDQLQAHEYSEPDVPPIDKNFVASSRRRSGCRATNLQRSHAWVLFDDGSRISIKYPTTDACVNRALQLPLDTLNMYLPRHRLGLPVAELDEEQSELACAYTPPCKVCNTYDPDEVCPNNETDCTPWQHGKCRLKFQPGLGVVFRRLELTPQIELNDRSGILVQADVRFGMQWEMRLTPLRCLSGECDSGNIRAVALPANNFVMDGVAYDAAAGLFHSVFLFTDTSVWATGLNSEGQVGDGTTVTRTFPRWVFWDAKDVGAGYYHSVFLKKNNVAYTVGRNKEGQLGDGTLAFSTTPKPVLDRVVQVAAGAFHTLFLRDDASVWATGSNSYGQLGDNTTITKTKPALVFSNVATAFASEYYSLFVQVDPLTEVRTLWSAGLFDAGLGQDNSDWSPVRFYNEEQVKKMQFDF